VHSSGSYRQTPPADEHEGLRRFARSIAGDPVFLNKSQQRIAIDSIVEKLDRMEIPVAVGACDPVHCHVLIRVGTRDAKLIFGRAKQLASFRLRRPVPGKLWEGSSGVFRVNTKHRFWEVVAYIRDHAKHGACVWVNPKLESTIQRQIEESPE
jgi:hypothetical protein